MGSLVAIIIIDFLLHHSVQYVRERDDPGLGDYPTRNWSDEH